MSDRDRLSDLIMRFSGDMPPCFEDEEYDCRGIVCRECYAPLSDYLLSNGVIVPPCKVGDMVYVIKYCRCRNPEAYQAQHCHKKDTKKTPKVLGSIMKQQYGMRPTNNYDWHKGTSFAWKPIGTICYKIIQKPFKLEWLTEIGKTVFLTREEAETALKERKEK